MGNTTQQVAFVNSCIVKYLLEQGWSQRTFAYNCRVSALASYDDNCNEIPQVAQKVLPAAAK